MSSGFLDPSHCDDRKNGVHVFFHPKTNFQPIFDKKKKKHLENTLETLLNQSMTPKNTKKKHQNPKSTQNQKSS
jgi:uncharacterized protein YaaR (DUF327 family)